MGKTSLLAVCVAVSGCASTLMPNSRAEDAIATSLHEPSAADVQVIQRQERWPSTYFTVRTTHHGIRHCIINGGTIDQLGVVYPAACESLSGAGR